MAKPIDQCLLATVTGGGLLYRKPEPVMSVFPPSGSGVEPKQLWIQERSFLGRALGVEPRAGFLTEGKNLPGGKAGGDVWTNFF